MSLLQNLAPEPIEIATQDAFRLVQKWTDMDKSVKTNFLGTKCRISIGGMDQQYEFASSCMDLFNGKLKDTSPISGEFDVYVAGGGLVQINVKDIGRATYDGWKEECNIVMKDGLKVLIKGYCPVDDKIKLA